MVKLKTEKIQSFFKEDDTEELIESTIVKALEYYYENYKSNLE